MIGKLAILAASTLLLCSCGDDNFALGKWMTAACTGDGARAIKPGEKPPEFEFRKANIILRFADQEQKIQEIEFMKDIKYDISADRVTAMSANGQPKPNEPRWIDIKKDPDGIMISFDGKNCVLKKT
ncbi:MAG TPA: hypothetical protein VD978_07795 [Azospirillum sp.]|nr:hypothetical protein [Azospirillum sp.]